MGYLDVVIRSLLDALGFNELALGGKLLHLLVALGADLFNGRCLFIGADDVVAGREDGHMLHHVLPGASNGVELRDAVDLIPKELHPDGKVAHVGQIDIHRVAVNTELIADKIDVVPLILQGDQLFAQVIPLHLHPGPQADDHAAIVDGVAQRVDAYRKFTRIPTPEPSLFYLKAFIERMVELARHQNPCDHITFHTKIDPADLILHADENLISQVVINLLKNAIQAIGDQPDGQIDILVYCNETEEVLIEIKNNGPVIPPEIAEHIFIPFFTTKEGGSGIGLSISRQIMRLSGGSLTLLPDNKETKFILKFK